MSSPNLNFRADVDQTTLEKTGYIVVGTTLGAYQITLAEAQASVHELHDAINDLRVGGKEDTTPESAPEASDVEPESETPKPAAKGRKRQTLKKT